MNQKYFFALAILGLILISGCIQGNTSTTSTGITSKLDISKAPTLNETAEITLMVTTIRNASNASVEIKLPEGFELISGNLNWNGEPIENQPRKLNIIVKAVKTGDWTIYGGGSGQDDYIYISINDNSATINDKPFAIPKRMKQYAESH